MRNMLPPEPKKDYTVLDFYVLNEYVKQISLEEGSGGVVISLMQYLYFWRKVDTNNILSSEIVHNGNAVEVSYR